jgi:hypothetical protein
MANERIAFAVISKYIVDRIQSISDEMFAAGTISRKLTYRSFSETGDYLNYQKKYADEASERSNSEVLVCVVNSGVVQDSAAAVDTYLQTARTVFMALEEYRADIEAAFMALSAEWKAYVTSINGSVTQISNDSGPTFNDKEELGEEIFTGYIDFDFIVFYKAKLSNTTILKIDGVPVPYISAQADRGYEQVPDLQKRAELLYMNNTSALTITIQGIVTDAAPIEKLRKDCLRNSSFGGEYLISLTTDGIEEFSQNMIPVGCTFTWQWGKSLSWVGTFKMQISY